MRNRAKNHGIVIMMVAVVLTAILSPAFASNGVIVNHLHKLANFSGTVPYNEATISVDRYHDEVYVLYQNFVRIYNASAMEVYGFGNDPSLGWMRDLAVDERGDIFLLSYGGRAAGSDQPSFVIVRCNYRGEPRESTTVKNLPPEYSRFLPQRLFYRDGHFLLVSTSQMLAVRADRDGTFREGYDFADLVEIPEKDRRDTEIFGFSVDGGGNMLFTVPVLFRAFRVSPGGSVVSFGKGGSAPGMFGVVSGIVADDHGNILVADSQRNVVMVFDPEFRFLTEFGYYGPKPQNLARPRNIAMGNSGKLYVVQLGQRGISVFSVTTD